MNKLKHVAIIVDGNRRWAKKNNKTKSEGHLAGSKNLEQLILKINDTDLEVLSLYVFSTENNKREKKEVDYLMNLFSKWFKIFNKKYKDKNIKIIFSGRKEGLNKKVVKEMNVLEEETKNNKGLILNFCLNYGGRAEIVDATKKIVVDITNNKINKEDITEELFQKYLYNNLPDIDLLIRTSKELRISNFMLWQLSYAEMYFTETLFPDFTFKEYQEIIREYHKRDRRFGTDNQHKNP